MMQAAVATALGKLRCDTIAVPEPSPGKALVRSLLASICGSDLHVVFMGFNVDRFPLPYGHPGHEGVGEVVEGGGSEFVPGDLVLTVPKILDAKTFAGYQLIEPEQLVWLPDTAPVSHLLMAQQLGTVIFGCRRLPPLVGQTVVIVGQGTVGLFHNFMLRRMGARRVIAIEPVPERLAAGRDLGADDAIDVTGSSATDAVLDLTGGHGADLVVEAVGSVETLNQSLKLARPNGRVAVFGIPTTMDPVPFDWDTFYRKSLYIHTVHGSQDEPGLPDFRRAVDLIADGEIDMSRFVTHHFPIARVQEAFDLALSKEKGALKVSLTF